MNRIFILLLCAALLLSLAACSSSNAPVPTDAPAAIGVTEPAVPTQIPTQAPTQPSAAQSSMGETVLVDHDAAAFTISRVSHNDHLGAQLHVQCVNRTDRSLMFSWDMVSVCGYMYDPLWAVEVAPGKTANSTIDLDTYALEKMGIHSIDEITFTLRISDSENWMEAPIVEEEFTIYPTGLDADTLVLPQRSAADGQVVIADDENIRFVIEHMDTETSSGCTLQVYLENKTDRNLMYAWDLVSVNGMMVDPFWATSVTAGKKAISEVSFYSADLEANGITDVETIEFQLIVSDYDNWEAGTLLEQTYTYTP